MLELQWILVAMAAIAASYALVAAFVFSLRPGETDTDHPKYLVLKENR